MATGRVNIKQLAEELSEPVERLLSLKNEKLKPEHYVGNGKNTWLNQEGAELLRLAVAAPLAVPTRLKALVLKSAPNPRWVYASIAGVPNKHPVAIPAKLRDRLVGKHIEVEAITDANGTTYRYAGRPNA